MPGLEAYEHFHPVFLYDSLYMLVGFIGIMWFIRRWEPKLLTGDVFFMYLIYWPLGRFFIEFLRPDAWLLGPLAAAQIWAIIVVVGAATAIIVRHRRYKPEELPPPPDEEDSDESEAEDEEEWADAWDDDWDDEPPEED